MNLYQRATDWVAACMGDKQRTSYPGFPESPAMTTAIVSFEVAHWSSHISPGDLVSVSHISGKAYHPTSDQLGAHTVRGSPVGYATEVERSMKVGGEVVTTVTVRLMPPAIPFDEEDRREKTEAFDIDQAVASRSRWPRHDDAARFRSQHGLPPVTRRNPMIDTERIELDREMVCGPRSSPVKENPIELTSEESGLLEDILQAAVEQNTDAEEQEVLTSLVNKLVD